jgi:hypothetical protein
MIDPKVLWQGEISESQLKVNLVEASKSNRAIDPEVEGKLQASWRQKGIEANENGAKLYDGTSYRLENLSFNEDTLTIEVSPMKFSVRSTLKKMPQLETLGEAYFSHGLSVGGFVKTKDSQYIFVRKSSKSASSLQRDVIGGVLETIEPQSGEGVLNMNRTELKEEVNVSPSMIEDMKVIGIVRSSTTDILIVTDTQLSIASAELRELFEKREDRELEGIEFVSPENLATYLEELGGYKTTMGKLL